MFYYLEGTVTVIEEGVAVIDVGGAGYLVNVSLNTLAKLDMGKRARLYTHVIVREDAFDIYGFCDTSEKRSFELLLGVSGVGPKAAQSILSCVTPEGLAMAVVSENEKALTAAPGIGKRIAQRVILELKDKIAKESAGMPVLPDKFSVSQPAAAGRAVSDAFAALTVLGYSQQEITSALKGADTESMTTEEIIKYVLKSSIKQ